MVLIYVSAVVATQLFGAHPDVHMQTHFGSVGKSMYTMFQLMTLEDWLSVANPTIDIFPWARAFFIPYILVTSFAVLNLFIGIIVDAFHIVKQDNLKEEENAQTQALTAEIHDVKLQLDEIQDSLKTLAKR